MLVDNDHRYTAFRPYGFVDVPVCKSKKSSIITISSHPFFANKFYKNKKVQTIRLKFNRKVLSQKSQANGFTIDPVWYSMWRFKLIFLRNILSHWLHLNSSSVCDFRCALSMHFSLYLDKVENIPIIIMGKCFWIYHNNLSKWDVFTPVRRYHTSMVVFPNGPSANDWLIHLAEDS